MEQLLRVVERSEMRCSRQRALTIPGMRCLFTPEIVKQYLISSVRDSRRLVVVVVGGGCRRRMRIQSTTQSVYQTLSAVDLVLQMPQPVFLPLSRHLAS